MSNNRILTELPRRGKLIDYQAMVGMKLELEYKQKIYIVEIIDYIKGNNRHNRFKIEYMGEIKEIDCGSFMSGHFGGILNEWTKSFKFKIGDEIKDKSRDIAIIGREYRQRIHTNGKSIINEKWYKYRCNKCRFPDGSFFENWIL